MQGCVLLMMWDSVNDLGAAHLFTSVQNDSEKMCMIPNAPDANAPVQNK